MPFKWKLFRALIFVEIISIGSLVGYTFYRSPFKGNSSEDLLVMSAVISLPLITAINGINSITMLPLLHLGNKTSFLRRIISWCFGILFFIACLLLLGGAISIFSELKKSTFDSGASRQYRIGLIIFFLFWVTIGLYILIMQIALSRTLKRNFKQNNFLDIEGIGKDFNN